MTRCHPLFALLALAPMALAEEPPKVILPPTPAPTVVIPDGKIIAQEYEPGCQTRRLFESDRAFDSFIGPISNPVLSKDPRALTEARLLFVQNWIPDEHPLNGGNLQAYGLQVRVALTDRLSFIADKDGYATIHPGRGGDLDGWLNIALGLKYALIRDVDRQLLVTAGFQYEPPTGEAEVFQGHGDGTFTGFVSAGKGFCDGTHVILNAGYQLPVDSDANSSFFYSQLHLDRQILGWLYPLVELNWFHWTEGGNRGLPAALGEGDGLINFGTTGVDGNNMVTVAVGLKAKVGNHLDIGAAYETPLTNRHDLLDHRVLVEMILRY